MIVAWLLNTTPCMFTQRVMMCWDIFPFQLCSTLSESVYKTDKVEKYKRSNMLKLSAISTHSCWEGFHGNVFSYCPLTQ